MCSVFVGLYLVVAPLVHARAKPLDHQKAAEFTAAEEEQLVAMTWSERFVYQAFTSFPYRHWWLAMFFRRPSDTTSGAERLTCLLSNILGGMAVSAVFFGNDSDNVVTIGMASLASAGLMLPVRLVFTLCFSKSRTLSEERLLHAGAPSRYAAADQKEDCPGPMRRIGWEEAGKDREETGEQREETATTRPDSRAKDKQVEKAKTYSYKLRLLGYLLMFGWNAGSFFVVLVFGLKFDMSQDSTGAFVRDGTAGVSDKWMLAVAVSQIMVFLCVVW
jgi:hypothetical protein